VIIPFEYGCIAHSDGDVLLHSICDAMLGAAGLKDIGFHFPDSDPEFKDIDSKILLGRTLELVKSKGYKIGNIDSTVCLERPKISPFIDSMKKVISEILEVTEDAVSIKATTTEKMGFAGRGEGVVAIAVAMILKP
ncbi:MAG: 2-C-methyl-D-erythritol 2,4-cyclodiphosphate synthase, partial [Bacteroidales bacterium]